MGAPMARQASFAAKGAAEIAASLRAARKVTLCPSSLRSHHAMLRGKSSCGNGRFGELAAAVRPEYHVLDLSPEQKYRISCRGAKRRRGHETIPQTVRNRPLSTAPDPVDFS